MPRASFTPLAESGLLIRLGDAIEAKTNARALALAEALGREAVPGIVDTVPAYTTVLVTFDPSITDATSVEQAARRLLPALNLRAAPDRMREIPVSYGGNGGPDLADVAAHSGLSVEDVIARHAAAQYRVACVGFCPGFAFLLGLPSELEMPRRRSPRTRVPIGSVAIGGGQTGVYPLETPGGWNLIGRTEVLLFDPSRSDPFFLRPGDTVRFVPVESVEEHASEVGLSLGRETERGEREVRAGSPGAGAAERPGFDSNRTTSLPVDAVAESVDRGTPFQRGDADGTDKERSRPLEDVSARDTGDVGVPERTVTILDGGAEATVQDLGRPGLMHLGVSPGGALDRRALVLGNRLLGNNPGAAGIEIALAGPRLRFDASVLAVVSGGDLGATLDGAPLPRWQPFMAGPGQTLAFDNVARPGFGLRAYLCLDGGISTPPIMGSRTTDLFGRIGGVDGRALRAGDALPLGTATTDPAAVLRRRLRVVPPSPEVDAGAIRVVLGPQLDRFTTEGVATLLDAEWTVGLRSDRMGLRLEGPAIDLSAGADAISEGITAGSIQVPGDGRPIALLPARQTIGGYPKIAVVIGADLDRLGQLGPNDTVRFSEVTLAEARRLTVAAAAELGEGAVLEGPGSAAGWDLNRAEMGRMETVDQWNPEAVERLVRAVAKTEATRFRLELTGSTTVRLEWDRSSVPAPVEPEREAPLLDPPSPFDTSAESDGVAIVTAPLLGVFYRRPDPDTPPFVEEGQPVAGGTVLGLIEVMKTFHEVRSSRRGVVAAFLVEDGATVQFGDPLVRLD